MTVKYGEALVAVDALTALSKLGSKEGKTLKRLAQMIRYCRKASEAFQDRRTLVLQSHAETKNGELIVKSDERGGQSAVIPNELEFQKALNSVLKEPAEVEGQAPQPFSWDDLVTFNEMPSAEVIERLGPFVTLDGE